MKPFFKELFEYDYTTNNAVIREIVKNEHTVSNDCIKIISHILNVHKVWNSKIMKEELDIDIWRLIDTKNLFSINDVNYTTSIMILDNFNLEEKTSWNMKSGKSFSNYNYDMLFQVINHSNYHRAQLAIYFRDCGIKPLQMDYILSKIKL